MAIDEDYWRQQSNAEARTQKTESDIPVFGWFHDMFRQDQVMPYAPNKSSYYYGGRPGGANEEQARMEAMGGSRAAQTDRQGAVYDMRGKTASRQYNQMGQAGMEDATQRADAQRFTSQLDANRQRQMGDAWNQRAMQFQGRSTPEMDMRGYNADRAMSLQAREQQGDALSRLRGYYEQGPGPSLAEAQLTQANDRTMQDTLAMARSGRGAGSSAAMQRQAAMQNAATQQGTNQSMAMLRAQEADAWRGRQLQAMGMEQQGLQGMRGADAQLAGMTGDMDARQAQMRMQGMQMNDAAMLGAAGVGAGYYGQGNQLWMGGQGLANQMYGQGQNYSAQMAGAANQAGLGYGQLANQASLGGYGLEQGYAQMGQNIQANQLQANIARENTFSQNVMAAQQQNAAADQARDGGGLGLVGSMLSLSDINAKTDIESVKVEAPELMPLPPPPESGGGGLLGGLLSDKRSKQALERKDETIDDLTAQLRSLLGKQDERQPRQQTSMSQAFGRAMQGYAQGMRGGSVYPQLQQPDTAALDRSQQAAEAVRQAPGYSYRYKQDAQKKFGVDDKQYFGPMAQDLEKTPVGRSVVRETPDGTKAIDTGRLALVNTAAQSAQQSEIDDLEKDLEELRAMLKARGGR